MTDLEIIALLVKAKELGITKEEVEAFKTQQIVPRGTITVPDLKATEIVVPGSPFDDLSDEEILYWATPHFDEIQRRKEAQKQKLAENNHD